jgi:hypothetical protein
MTTTTEDEKRKVADALFADGRIIHDLSNLRKGNSSPKYNGEGVRKRATDTVETRAKRYGKAVLRLTASKK